MRSLTSSFKSLTNDRFRVAARLPDLEGCWCALFDDNLPGDCFYGVGVGTLYTGTC